MPGQDILAFADELGTATAAPAIPEARQLHLVIFFLDREEYAVPIELVREVVRVADITRVPHAPPHIRGVMNLRGRILPVMEIRTRLGMEPAQLTPTSRVVVVEVNRRTVGLLVDAVAQVTRVSEQLITSPPEEVRAAGGEAVIGVAQVGKRLLVLLDLDRMLRTDSQDPSLPVRP
jgi:purine-binding chemotaxis protein CheW